MATSPKAKRPKWHSGALLKAPEQKSLTEAAG